MAIFNQSIDSLYQQFSSSPNGLNNDNVILNANKFGKNQIKATKKTSLINRFFAQFKNIMIIVLLISAILSIIIALTTNKNEDLFEGFLILGIVITNAIIGVFQEKRASDAIALLTKQTEPISKVYRNGTLTKIHNSEIVVGDIVFIKAGDIVPADIRIIECNNLKCDESSLTGESHAVFKSASSILKENTPLSEQENMCFSGTSCTYGNAKGIVVRVGENTELGRIAKLLKNKIKEKTPLEKNIDKIGKIITFGVLAITIVVFLFQLLFAKNTSFMDAFLISVALAVAAIPEGLPAVITIVMALGVEKLAKQKAIVKTLSSVETLGCCNVICSDKTGTLTQNKMTVKHLFINNKLTTDFTNSSLETELLYSAITCCNNARIDSTQNFIGDATEVSLLKLSNQYFPLQDFSSIRLHEIPFDSSRKIMSTINKTSKGIFMFSKGAYDFLINKCSYIQINGTVLPLTTTIKKDLNNAVNTLAKNAERVLAVSYKNYTQENYTDCKEENLIFLGLVGIIDPPKKEAKLAIQDCKHAGLKTVMITGDHPETAFAIAQELDIASSKNEIITGSQIDNLSIKQLAKIINNFSVFARVSPEHKVKIVEAFKKTSKIVAMTGDGVNDAPSLSKADIGLCMGITGTDVTKDVSDLIITDDNFSTIVVAIKQGRTIYSNIQKIIQFLISTNLVEVLGIFVSTLIMSDCTFILPSQILFINLVTDSFPAFALGLEKPEKNILNKPPRNTKDTVFSGRIGTNIIYQALVQTLLVLIVFVCAVHKYGNNVASTMVFLIICFMQLIHAVNCKTLESIFKINIFNNRAFNISFIGLFVLILLVAFVPFLQTAFGIVSLNLTQWLIVCFSSISIIPLVEICKLFVNKYYNKKRKTTNN